MKHIKIKWKLVIRVGKDVIIIYGKKLFVFGNDSSVKLPMSGEEEIQQDTITGTVKRSQCVMLWVRFCINGICLSKVA